MQGNLTALLITSAIVLVVIAIGFIAGRDKSSRSSVEEWAVGGRRFWKPARLAFSRKQIYILLIHS